MIIRGAILICISGLLVACQQTIPVAKPTVETALGQAMNENADERQSEPLQDIPQSIREALRPEAAASPELELFGEPRYDIRADNTDARTFFSSLINDTQYSIAIHPEVQGQITLDLKQVRLQDVLELAGEIYGYDIRRKGNVYRVYPSGIRSETYSVNYLLMQRDGTTNSSVSSGGVSQFGGGGNNGNQGGGSNQGLGGSNNGNIQGGSGGSNGTTISTTTNTDFWAQLETTLVNFVGTQNGRNVLVSPQAGLVTVRAMPDELREVRQFLKASEDSIQRQVILEARIIELTLDDEYQQGINWTEILSHSGSTDFRFSASGQTSGNSITGNLGGLANLSFLNADFSGVLSLLSTQGSVSVLSSPRVTALNNQKAVIKVGNDEYFVTDISNTSTSNGDTTTSTPDVQLTPFFSGIALDVTPQIDEHGSVILHVHPSVIETEEQTKVVTINQESIVLPLAQSNIRESDTVIQARSGEIVVIGGLMQSVSNNTKSKTPLLGDVPLFGNLFKNRRDVVQKKELVILIKPTVVRSGTWKNQIQQSKEYIADWLYVD